MGQRFSANINESARPTDGNRSNGALRRTASTSPRSMRSNDRIRFDPLSRSARARSSPLSAPSEPIGRLESPQQTSTRMVTRSMTRRTQSRAMPATINPLRRTGSGSGSSPLQHLEQSNNMPTLAPSTIADVITEAVLSAFRERHGNMESAANAVAHAAAAAAVSVATNTAATATTAAAAAANNNNNNNNNDMETTPTPTPASASIPVRTFAMPHIPMTFPRNVQQELPAQASVQNPPVSPQTTLSTGEASEESFFRYVRLPAMFAAMPEGDNAEQRREITMPMFIVGYRVRAAADDRHQHSHSPGQEERNMVLETDTRRRSPRLAERDDRRGRQQQQSDEDQQHNHTVASRWVVYILSGVGDGGLTGLSDSPTYEELLALAESIGYARNPISIDQINASAPIQRYTAQVGGSMIGNIEKCLVCLEAFEEMESVRVLKCHHGFHQDCIDKWLTEGQNRCPLCRVAPVERHSQQHEEAH